MTQSERALCAVEMLKPVKKRSIWSYDFKIEAEKRETRSCSALRRHFSQAEHVYVFTLIRVWCGLARMLPPVEWEVATISLLWF